MDSTDICAHIRQEEQGGWNEEDYGYDADHPEGDDEEDDLQPSPPKKKSLSKTTGKRSHKESGKTAWPFLNLPI